MVPTTTCLVAGNGDIKPVESGSAPPDVRAPGDFVPVLSPLQRAATIRQGGSPAHGAGPARHARSTADQSRDGI